MPKYRVNVERIEWASTEFIVEAATPVEAIQEAEAEAGNYEFGSGNAEFEVGTPVEIND